MEYYEIIVSSCIDKKRARDFFGMDITHIETGKTLLSGKLVDQAALFCVISRIRDMNLTLISIKKNDKEMEMKHDGFENRLNKI